MFFQFNTVLPVPVMIATVSTMATGKNFLLYAVDEGNSTAAIQPNYG